MLGEYLGSAEFSLDADLDPVSITMPSDLAGNPKNGYADFITLCCRNDADDAFLEWNMYPTEDDTTPDTYPDWKVAINLKYSPGETKFLANTKSGTGTLQVGFWKK